jgi:cation diffusion facilitator family transporter
VHDHYHDDDRRSRPGHYRRGQNHAGGHRWRRVRRLRVGHSHDPADAVDSALESSRAGIRAVWVSLTGLATTAAAQAVITAVSGSVALLGDTLHNLADALTAVPLGVAFLLGRRAATRAYTYSYGRAEDLAGVLIIAVIAASAVAAGWTAIGRLLDPAQVTHLPYVAAAGLIGFAGNELVARYRITVGQRIGSAALVADGLHARTDGFTSLAVVAAAAGAWAGWEWADPVVGLAITVAVGFVLKDAAGQVYRRLMDAVDPALVDTAEQRLATTPGVRAVSAVRLRWIGHRLHAETALAVDADLSVAAAHAIAVDAEHRLLHAVPRLASVTVHTDPATTDTDPHHALAHHRSPHHASHPTQATG